MMKIRKIEAEIIEALKLGIEETKEIAKEINKNYSTIHSSLGRMVMYGLVRKVEKGKYEPAIETYTIAADHEVAQYRKKEITSQPDPLLEQEITIEDEVKDKDFIKGHVEATIDRKVILSKLRKEGFHITRFELNQLIILNKWNAKPRTSTDHQKSISA